MKLVEEETTVNVFLMYFLNFETEVKDFAIDSCSWKSVDFTIVDLTEFVDRKFYKLIPTVKTAVSLVHSIERCRDDLRWWGAKFRANSQRSCFEEYDRTGVVAHRQAFAAYFRERNDRYYTINEDEHPVWWKPMSDRHYTDRQVLVLDEVASKNLALIFIFF
jgi:hypothetical protein